MEDITKYLRHLPTCTMMQDWSEAESALADTPARFRGPDYDQALAEMNAKRNTCSCGLSTVKEKILKLERDALYKGLELVRNLIPVHSRSKQLSLVIGEFEKFYFNYGAADPMPMCSCGGGEYDGHNVNCPWQEDGI